MNATRPARRPSRWFRVRGFADDLECTRVYSRRSAVGAFTLLEILLALGLLAVLGTVLIGASARALSDKPVSPDDVFWKAVGEARKLALNSEREVRLGFLDDREKGRRFTIDDGLGLKEFPVLATGDIGVNLLSGQKVSGSAIILAGQVVETESLSFVTFYPDGTCTSFRVQIRSGVNSHILSIDPWTCSPVLPEDPSR